MKWVPCITVVGLILTVSPIGATDTLTTQTLQEMKQRDEPIIRSGISLHGKIRGWSPLGDRKSVAGLARCYNFRFTCKRLTAVYEEAVEFFEEIPQRTEPSDSEAKGRGLIYDEEAAQHFLFAARKRVFHERGFLNAVLRTNGSLYVEPDGRFGITVYEGYLLELYPLDHLWKTLTWACDVLLCSGRGYTFVMDLSSASCRKRADGLIEIQAKGCEAPDLPLPTGFFADNPREGRSSLWMLVVDPKADYLVREAVFSVNEKPLIQIKTSGQLKTNGAVIAKSGERRIKPEVPYEEIRVEFTKGEWWFSQLFYEEVRHALLNPPDGTRISDFRFGDTPFTFTYRRNEGR